MEPDEPITPPEEEPHVESFEVRADVTDDPSGTPTGDDVWTNIPAEEHPTVEDSENPFDDLDAPASDSAPHLSPGSERAQSALFSDLDALPSVDRRSVELPPDASEYPEGHFYAEQAAARSMPRPSSPTAVGDTTDATGHSTPTTLPADASEYPEGHYFAEQAAARGLTRFPKPAPAAEAAETRRDPEEPRSQVDSSPQQEDIGDHTSDRHPEPALDVGDEPVPTDANAAADAIWNDVEASVRNDEASAEVDAEDDGKNMAEEIAKPAWTVDGLEQLNKELEAVSFPGFEQFNGIHGTPIEDLRLWDQQDEPFSCAVSTTDMLFRSCGYDIGESTLATLFQAMGIYDPAQGTRIDLIAEAVNHAVTDTDLRVEAVEINHFTEQTLEALLDNGVRPLIGVNSAELYSPAQRFLNSIGVVPNTGHAVQLTGIIRSEKGSFALINDPGFPDGAGRVIPLDIFMSAASKLGNTAVVLIPI